MNALRCCSCQQFVSVENSHAHVEMGDYGQIHSIEHECFNCWGPITDPDFTPGGPADVLPISAYD